MNEQELIEIINCGESSKVQLAEKGLTLEKALVAKKVMRNNHLTLAGLLFFGIE